MAARDHAEFFGSGAADIDQAPARKGAAIIDAHHDAAAIGGVSDTHAAAEGQAAVGGGEGVLVETLAAGGFPAMVAGAVIRGLAFGAVKLH